MAYELQRDTFAVDSWKRAAATQVPLQKTKELVRYVQKVIDDERATDLLFLYTYVDASNYPSDAGAVARSYVTSPRADRLVYAGTWRLANVRVDPQLPGYIQTLRLGFAQAIAWDEAFIVGGPMLTAKERDIVVEFRNFDPAYVEAAMQALMAQSPLMNPVVQTNTFTGTWIISNIQPRQEDDGCYTIVASLSYVTSVTDISSLSALTPIRQVTRDVDHAFGEAGGYSSHLSYSNHDGIVLSYRRLNPASKDVIEALTDANFQSLLSASEQTAFEFVKKDFREVAEDHTYTLQLAYARVNRRSWPSGGAAPDLTVYQNQNTVKEGRERMWLGYERSDEDTIIAALINGGDRDDVAGYTVSAVRYSDNDDGSMNFTQVLVKETKGAAGSEIEVQDIAKIAPHAIQSGTIYRMVIINENLEGRGNAYSNRSDTFIDYTLVDTKEELQANGLWSKYYYYESVEFRAWSNDNSPDLVDIANEGTNFERRTRTWLRIKKADYDSAKYNLQQGIGQGNIADYQVTLINPSDNGDGSMNWTQVMEKARDWPTTGLPGGVTTHPFGSDVYEPLNIGAAAEGYKYTYNSYKCESSNTAIIRAVVALAAVTGTVGAITYGIKKIDVMDRHNGIFDVALIISTDTYRSGISETTGIDYDRRWVESAGIYDANYGRKRMYSRKVSQHFHVNIRDNWREAFNEIKDVLYPNADGPKPCPDGGWMVFIPQADPVYAAWTEDETMA